MTQYIRSVLGLVSFSKNVRRFFLKKLDHTLWSKDEIIEAFNSAHLEAHMQVLKDLESVNWPEDET